MTSESPAWEASVEHGSHPNDLIVEACVYNADFTENKQTVYYYDEPHYLEASPAAVPRNQERPLFTKTDFLWNLGTNTPAQLAQYSNFTCRFTGREVTIVTQAKMVVYPFTSDETAKPTHVMCRTPKWHRNEPVILDLAVNG